MRPSVKSGKAENAQVFLYFPMEKSPFPPKDEFQSAEGQLADFSLELTSTNSLWLLLPPFRPCHATMQFKALKA